MGLLKHATPFLPLGPDIASILAVAYQLYIPFWLIYLERGTPKNFKIYFYGFFEDSKGIDWQNLWIDTKRTLMVTIATFAPYLLVYHFTQVMLASHYNSRATFSLIWPPDLWHMVVVNLLLIALPEELFYRGFVQTQLLKRWPNRIQFLGIPLGRAVIVTSLIFAFGHFIGEYNAARLLPFFPALIFSALTYHSRSIVGALAYHALCNTFSAVLQSSYHWS